MFSQWGKTTFPSLKGKYFNSEHEGDMRRFWTVYFICHRRILDALEDKGIFVEVKQ